MAVDGGHVGSFSEANQDRNIRRRPGLSRLMLPTVCFAVLIAAAAPSLARALRGFRAAKDQGTTAAIVRARAAWFFRQRASANGHIPNALLVNALQQNQLAITQHRTYFDQLSEKAPQIAAQPRVWTPLGPQPTANNIFYGNVSGRVTALVSDPCDATGNTVYAGAADGGVWVSFNALSGNPVTWTPLTDQEPSVAVGAIALIPGSCPTFGGHAQSSEIVVGTGESNFAQDNMYGAGVPAVGKWRADLEAGPNIYTRGIARSGRKRAIHRRDRGAAKRRASGAAGGSAGNGLRRGRHAAFGRVAFDGRGRDLDAFATRRDVRERSAI